MRVYVLIVKYVSTYILASWFIYTEYTTYQIVLYMRYCYNHSGTLRLISVLFQICLIYIIYIYCVKSAFRILCIKLSIGMLLFHCCMVSVLMVDWCVQAIKVIAYL